MRAHSLNRRELLRGAARTSLAAGLVGSASLLVLRPHGRRDCVKVIACGDCAVFGRCELSKAKAARQEAPRA